MMIKNKWFWIVDALVWELDQKGLVGAVKSCILNITFLHCMQIGEIVYKSAFITLIFEVCESIDSWEQLVKG